MATDHVDQILEQWQRERPDVDVTPMAVVFRVKRLAKILDHATTANFARHGLEPREFDVLSTLRRAGAPYRVSAGALGRALMITSGTVTHRIDGLEAGGLVRRVDDPGDRRGVQVELTAAGLRKVDTVLARHLETERALLEGLTEAQQHQLVGLLRRALLALGDALPTGATEGVTDGVADGAASGVAKRVANTAAEGAAAAARSRRSSKPARAAARRRLGHG